VGVCEKRVMQAIVLCTSHCCGSCTTSVCGWLWLVYTDVSEHFVAGGWGEEQRMLIAGRWVSALTLLAVVASLMRLFFAAACHVRLLMNNTRLCMVFLWAQGSAWCAQLLVPSTV